MTARREEGELGAGGGGARSAARAARESDAGATKAIIRKWIKSTKHIFFESLNDIEVYNLVQELLNCDY